MSYGSALQRCLPEFPRESKPLAVSAAVRVNGRLHWTSSDSEEGLAAGNAIFPVYSITKTLTAICVLRLFETRSLELTDPVKKWLPDLAVGDGITLAHLLRHRSGLSDYGPLPEYHEAVRSQPSQPWSRQQFLDAVLPKGMLFAAGGGWAYSNIGYMLLLQVLESITRQPFARIVQSLLIEPLALERTFVVERREDWGRCVPGFGPEVDVEGRLIDVRQAYDPGWCAPGLVASTAEEITYVLDSLLAGYLLQADTLAEMLALTVITDAPGETLSGGMGLFSDRASPHGRNYGHGGGGPGYELDVTTLPETRLGRVTVAVFANRSCGPQAPHRAAHCEAALLSQLLDNRI